jgi:hypothetical protein
MTPTVSNTAGGLRPYAEEQLRFPGHSRIGRWPAVEPPATNWCCTSSVHEGSCTSLRNWPDEKIAGQIDEKNREEQVIGLSLANQDENLHHL